MNLQNLEEVYKLAETLKQLKAIKAHAEDRYTREPVYYIGIRAENRGATTVEIPLGPFIKFIDEQIAAVGGQLNALGVKV